MFNPINHPAARELRLAFGLPDDDDTPWLALLFRVRSLLNPEATTDTGRISVRHDAVHEDAADLRGALGLDDSDRSSWNEMLHRVIALRDFTRDEATAQVRRALAIGGRVTWDEVIAELYRRTQVNRKGWVSGWGTVEQIGHATFYGEVRTELCGGVPMIYLLLPEIEATDDREGLPEQEVFFPLATLYRYTPTSEHEVVSARRAQAPLKMETRAPRPPASDESTRLAVKLAHRGRYKLDAYGLDELTPENRAELTAWADAGCPDPTPEVYDQDVPF